MEIHRFVINGSTYILDVPTTRCIELDIVADAILNYLTSGYNDEQIIESLLKQYPVEELKIAIQEIHELQENGILITEKEVPTSSQDCPITNLTLNVSHACNLACTYCFAGHGHYGGKSSQMSKITARRAIDLLLELSAQQTQITIVFFGGEPLLNIPVIKDSVTYAKEQALRYGKSISFSMTTNGLLLSDELIEYFDENQVYILISIDGSRQIQDMQRPLPNGKGSYDILLPRVQALSKHRKGRISARSTITRQNVEFSQVVDHLSSIGFGRVYCMPMTATCPGDMLELTEEEIISMEVEYEKMVKRILDALECGKGYAFGGFHRYINLIHGSQKRPYACGVGRSMITVTPSGDIFPCHRFVGMEKFKAGNVWKELDIPGMQKTFSNASVQSLPGCKECWARYVCSGRCLNLHAKEDGSFGWPNSLLCRLWKREIELAFFLYSQVKEKYPAALPNQHQSPQRSI